MTIVGFIGSGNIGTTVARLAVEVGHQVVLSNSRGPDTLADEEAAAAGDIVVVSVPVKAFPPHARRTTGREDSGRHVQLRPRA